MNALTFLQALSDQLDAMHGKRVRVHVEQAVARAANEDELFDRFVARLNRTGGPKLSPRAIAQ